MQLTCTHCGFIASSLDIKKEDALAEIMLKFSKHIMDSDLKSKHIEQFKQIMQDHAMLMALAVSVILLAKHSTLLDTALDTEDFIQIKFSEMVDKVQDCLGVEVFDNKPSIDSASVEASYNKEGGKLELVPPASTSAQIT